MKYALIGDLDHGVDQEEGRLVFAAVAAGVAHLLDAGIL